MQNEYITCISEETHAAFDKFAATIQATDIQDINRPCKTLTPKTDSLYMKTLAAWVKNGLINWEFGQMSTDKDIAIIAIVATLKQRGFSFGAIRQVKAMLDAPMYDNVSMLEFALLLCRKPTIDPLLETPILVIDGRNKTCLASSTDMSTICFWHGHSTYSHFVLDVRRVISECDFVNKICSSEPGEMTGMSAQIARHLYGDSVHSVTVDWKRGLLTTVADSSVAPAYGERKIKYQDKTITLDVTKTLEKLN